MDLTTRCPQCGTTFSASLQQLQLRKGYIRCVNCAHIFDGFEAVVSPASPAQEPVIPPSVVRQRPAPAADAPGRTAPQQAAGHTVSPDAEMPRGGTADPFTISSGRDAGPHATRQDPVFRVGEPLSAPKSKSEPVIGQPQAGPAKEPQTGLPQVRRRDDGLAPQVYVEPRRPASGPGEAAPAFLDGDIAAGRNPVRIVWAALVIIGLALLLAQLTYIYRAQIANQAAFLRPILERACVPLHCKVPYARRIDAISIMSSSLRSGSAAMAEGAANPAGVAGSDSMVLQLTLRNTYDKPQEWPTLVLDLTDFSGTLIVRKNLPPESYLAPEAKNQPFPAGSEASISVPIALDGLKINGYKLDKFFQ
ncbi:DUF3426 domain-containing protein [Pollutimonas sp. H1-120]|uniref:DUF3426 domain-containing protein n=1 Tax=Pollutimonas sp. H1-120 TaxID=3148824 RepID=UPI003B5289C0